MAGVGLAFVLNRVLGLVRDEIIAAKFGTSADLDAYYAAFRIPDFLFLVIASGAFAVYVANFGSYNKTYGSLAGVIMFLVWLWISNIAVLLGAELNAELQRGRAIAGGHPDEKEPYLELRDTRKIRERDAL